ncbi:monovalent cation/H+ antiporter subunit D [Altererythrobacter xixiisoli]|uniref:Monovalent cation/H+ antiporter subunit D n=1 Tax=Croceibacterium xixiisoli TaxID=1476466 RepID=A0A6I4TYF5_9SPHN|nr:monovalent cation/H+ antiporter subunit D [Croceibacterium xixiisoli]MXP00311.1 monovalent cation/H+ antiporter subunit D [Croceibacterium xixiisoli]
MQHLIVAPVVLPIAVCAVMLAFNERRRMLKRALSLATTAALMVIAALILWQADKTGVPQVYLLGNWSAPFGIVLVADRLSAMMLCLVSVLGFTALLYSFARWDRSGPRFHVLFLLLLAGVNGAFLTGDLFNLFVFFEVLLAASYGLILHGAGEERTRASLHYITINIATSLLFLIGVAMIYAVTGTLNMADLAARMATVPPEDLMLLEAGAAVLGIAFLVKSGIWPLSFWLVRTYAAAVPPVAAVFAVMTKVGIYIVLRLNSLLFGGAWAETAGFADNWLIWAGFATIAFGVLGILSARTLSRVAGHYVLVSSGTLLAVIGMGGLELTSAMLFYLVSSTLSVGALYLIIEPVERNADEDDIIPGLEEPVFDDEYTGAIEEEENEKGIVIPGSIAVLGGGFIFCTLLLAGLPPLSGFIAKFAIVDALFSGPVISAKAWILITLIILSGLTTLVALTRAGIDLIWTPAEDSPVHLNVTEIVPIGLLLAACLVSMILAGPIFSYMEAVAADLGDASLYIDAVMNAPRAGEPEMGEAL